MPSHAPARVRRWQATAILTLFFIAVAGAAAIGWWYARESPPHQGPIILISVDGLPAAALPAYGAERLDTPGIDALAAHAVVFDRAYSHSPQTLPAHASILSGQLPFEHGVRDEAGYALEPTTRTLAELLRNRGFRTGAAVSSFLLRRDAGVAQGFSFFDGEDRTAADGDAVVADDQRGAPEPITRSGALTLEAAEVWARAQESRRYFLLVQVDAADADMAVTRISRLLEERNFYDSATIVLVGDGAGADVGGEEDALRVPLLIKQPAHEGAQRRVSIPVQQIDLLPTILDLVRAPIPGDLRGRSLRPILSDDNGRLTPQPIYSESLAAQFRIGGYPLFAVTVNDLRYVRGGDETLVRLAPPLVDAVPADTPEPADDGVIAGPLDRGALIEEMAPLRATLDRLLAQQTIQPPVRASDDVLDRLALAGYLPGLDTSTAGDVHLVDIGQQQTILAAHHAAAQLVGQRKVTAAIRALQNIVRDHPTLAVVHYQIGVLSAELRRTEDAIGALRTAAALRPEAPEVPRALALALARAGQTEEAEKQAVLAVTLAEPHGARELAAAHVAAARVALARNDPEAAMRHADAVQAAEPTIPMRPFVQGTLLIEAGRYDEAVPVLVEAAAMMGQHGTTLEGLQLQLGEALSRLDRPMESEAAYREELRRYPHSIRAYVGLGTLYGASGDDVAAERVVDDLLAMAPTPEGYDAAARLWTDLGKPARAEALRSDARVRFRGDPSQSLVASGRRR